MDRGQVRVEGWGVVVEERGEDALGGDPAGTASAPNVAPHFPIKPGLPALILPVHNVVPQ